MWKIILLLLFPFFLLSTGQGIDATTTSTFGSAGKGITLHPSSEGEQILWEQNCTGFLCVLDHQWYGGSWPTYSASRLRFYVDDESTPSIDGQMFLSYGIGFKDDDAPWSAGALFGKTGSPSGVFNTINIPFKTHIRLSIQTVDLNKTKSFWWIYRGYQLQDPQAGIMIGRFSLPPSARLRLFMIEGQVLETLEFLHLFNVTSSGMILMTTLSVSTDTDNHFQYLEACLRTYTNGKRMLLSSGTEDYFLGTYYFNKGGYHNPVAGLTHKLPKNSQFSAYRIHVDDPILFNSADGPFSMVWRNGEHGHCDDGTTPTPYTLPNATVFAYSWVYVW